MQKSELSFIVKSYLFWIVVLFTILFFAVKFIPVQKDFLGGGHTNYLKNPYIWSWGNFDGEHYMAVAQNGYKPLTYFFFPTYPVLIKFFSTFFGTSLHSYLFSGIFVSYASLVIGLIGFYKLIRLDFKANIARLSILLLLIFPTSFYFASVYTESLFFALTIWFFYLARKKNYLIAAVIAGVATTTRVVGIILPLVLLVEMLKEKENIFKFKNILSLLISPLGIITYMSFLKAATGNFLEFFSTVSIFGAQRESALITLPQVFYRYIFKVLPSIHTTFFPAIFTPWIEFTVAIFFLAISVWAFFKLRLSYSIFLLFGYLIPTLSGSFSSLPRYVLILFPAFILLASNFTKHKFLLVAFSVISSILLVISFSLFARGYWVS